MHAEYCDMDQCSCRRSGRLHNDMSLLSIAEITNWLPEASIPTHSLAVDFEYCRQI